MCFETVTVEVADPPSERITMSEKELADFYFGREQSYSRRMTTCTEESVKFWNERCKTMKTYIVNGEQFKYLVFDFMYVIDADTDEDGEITEIYGVDGYYVRPIDEVMPPKEEEN